MPITMAVVVEEALDARAEISGRDARIIDRAQRQIPDSPRRALRAVA